MEIIKGAALGSISIQTNQTGMYYEKIDYGRYRITFANLKNTVQTVTISNGVKSIAIPVKFTAAGYTD